MDNPQLLRIQENLKLLKLNRTGQQLEMLLQEASKNEVSYSDFLDKLPRTTGQPRWYQAGNFGGHTFRHIGLPLRGFPN
ncbi:hypothetical protein [Pelotomaculum propionicicum]|uniref:Uncharacterized protein n=1 Tax=Pelotomaculum propionicicum TaxID=258475 RepID=A0A4Y7RPX1_9FIRM|nr:hypothetical protein [Pelotomaculum propionicicum]NLI13170.1 hypothetical protein [Peptococcaceae bacterium]TEB11045.1 hypothetical protein Pmgp_01917 [Pelotomaculum propionicicum]